MLAKMWRVYQIFHNPMPDTKVLYKPLYSNCNVMSNSRIIILYAAFERSTCDGDHFGCNWCCCATSLVGDISTILERQHHTGERYGEPQR